jgi:hypothetical protein
MKSKTLIILLFLVSLCSFGQHNSEVDKVIKNLSWQSFSYLQSITPFVPIFLGEADELVDFGESAAEKLFQSINIPNKTVVIHLILTKIFEPAESYIYPHLINDYCEKKENMLHFLSNGLVWDWLDKSGFSIQQNQIDRIRLYWDKKLHDKPNAFSIDPEDLFYEIQQRDSIEFHCTDHKRYKNNSSQLDPQYLNDLLFIKYTNPKFKKVFNILGTDSLCRHYDDSMWVIYVADGIQFEFDRNQILKALFIKANYKGSLLNGIKMTDNRDIVKMKLGAPEEYHGSSSYTYDWIYRNYGILIAFGVSNRIINLQINSFATEANHAIREIIYRGVIK